MKKIKYITKLFALASLFMLSGCGDDFLNTEPSTAIGEVTAETSEKGLKGILEGIHYMTYSYDWNNAHLFGTGQAAINMQLDMMGDDFINTLPAYFMGVHRYEDHIDPNGSSDNRKINYRVWDFYYTLILHANKLIKGTNDSQLPENIKSRLLGEGYAYRAWAYHNLVQLFGKRYVKGAANDQLGVIIRNENQLKEPLKRSTVAEVYTQIDKDMTLALENLSNTKDLKIKNAIRYSTACGIAARIALSKSDWVNAEKYAQEAIEKSGATLQTGKDLCNGFNDYKATEWMWGYTQGPTQDFGYYSFYADYSYNFNGYNSGLRFAVNRGIYDLMGEKDARRGWWVCLDRGDKIPEDAYDQETKSYNEYFKGGLQNPGWETTGQSIKFKARAKDNSRGDLLIMRLAEMYYIKAEAQARQDKFPEAATTLNTLMVTRDPDYNTTATGEALIDEIMRNKRIDLWGEGQRFYDVKRLGVIISRVNAKNIDYLTGVKKENAITRNTGKYILRIPQTADSKYWEFAIPYDEVKGNPLCEQNEL